MKERPILFQGAMVRALLAGTKTQTRRALKRQPPANTVAMGTWHHPDPRDHWYAWTQDDGPDPADFFNGGKIDEWDPLPCPYGMKGDRLWVRETFAAYGGTETCYHYRADTNVPNPNFGWKPSIHMPRAASRMLLEVTRVRAERVQAISDADLAAEGIQELIDAGVDHDGTPRDTYRVLWEAINGASSWHANPWVWVVEFKPT